VAAGRTSANVSTCTQPTASAWSPLVMYIRL
jgi:hypothetical protein